MSNSEKFMWVCELTKDMPTKKWKSTDVMELESEDDTDFVIHSLIFKTAVLGAKAADGERNLVSVKTKGYQEKEFEQPLFSLTLGRNDMVSGMDLTLASDHNQEVEFKLMEGAGPVFITCTHLLELPSADEQHTIMTASDGDLEESCEESGEEEEEEEKAATDEDMGATNGKRLTAAALKIANAKNGKTNGTNGAAKKDEVMADEMVDEKPTKRKRN
jgi:hypothetical protein